jgi:hypothetical protein
MLLRSPYVASSIGDPRSPLGLDAYAAGTGREVGTPVPLQRFVEYGRWVASEVVPDVDTRRVRLVEHDGSEFVLLLDDGDRVVSRRLVVAAGIGFFPRVPAVFQGLPADLVSHASEHPDLSRFAGRRVLVVGAGQSALESAALLHEAGAEVAVVARAAGVRWLGRHPWLRSLGPVSSVLYAPAEVGPPLLCQLVEAPHVLRRAPVQRRHQLDVRSIRPAGAAWLRPRVEGLVPIELGREVVAAEAADGGVAVTFSDGARRVHDHVLLGTGYRVDLSRYPFLSPDLLGRVRQVDGYPVLGRGFESSVPGLHFLGAPAAHSYGPLMRFVAGTRFAAAELTRTVAPSAARRSGALSARTS